MTKSSLWQPFAVRKGPDFAVDSGASSNLSTWAGLAKLRAKAPRSDGAPRHLALPQGGARSRAGAFRRADERVGCLRRTSGGGGTRGDQRFREESPKPSGLRIPSRTRSRAGPGGCPRRRGPALAHAHPTASLTTGAVGRPGGARSDRRGHGRSPASRNRAGLLARATQHSPEVRASRGGIVCDVHALAEPIGSARPAGIEGAAEVAA